MCQSYSILPWDHSASESLLCQCWPGTALCGTPSWECPGINLGLAQDCLGLLRDGGGLAVTACFRGVRTIGWPNCPWLNRRRMQPHPQWNHLQPAILGCCIWKYTHTQLQGQSYAKIMAKKCGETTTQQETDSLCWWCCVQNLSNLSSRWIHQIKRVWDHDKSLQVQWDCSSLIQD